MEREAARAPSLQCSPWRVSVVTAVSFPPVQAEGPRTHSPSRDRPPVERVDQWGGGIAAAEARPSARVGGLVPARASLLGGAPEPRGQPGHPKRTVFAAILAFASMRTRDSRSLARASLCASPPPRLFCPVVGAHARLPTWAVMDSGATVGGTRERAASRGKGHVEGKFSRARPRGVVPSLISRSGLFSSRWIYRTWYYFAVRFGRRKERILGGISLLQIIVQWGEGDDSGMGQFR